jgi:uncharacterized protein YndB with AHSA1/START domain
VFRRVLADPVDAAWSAMTESDRLGRWFGTYTGTGRVGGTVELLMTAAEDAGGPPSGMAPLECAPRERLVVEVTDAGASESWRIAATRSPEGDATVLVFDQLVPAGMRPADVGPGWHRYLDRLVASLRGAPMPGWDDYAGLGGSTPTPDRARIDPAPRHGARSCPLPADSAESEIRLVVLPRPGRTWHMGGLTAQHPMVAELLVRERQAELHRAARQAGLRRAARDASRQDAASRAGPRRVPGWRRRAGWTLIELGLRLVVERPPAART